MITTFYARMGTCNICHEEDIVAEYYDGEYFPTFCKTCLKKMIKDIDNIKRHNKDNIKGQNAGREIKMDKLYKHIQKTVEERQDLEINAEFIHYTSIIQAPSLDITITPRNQYSHIKYMTREERERTTISELYISGEIQIPADADENEAIKQFNNYIEHIDKLINAEREYQEKMLAEQGYEGKR